MDGLFVLLALAVLAIPVAVIVLIVGQFGLKSRVAKLERDLLATRIALRDMTADAPATPTKKSAKAAEAPKSATEPEKPKVAAAQATGDATAKSPVPQRPTVAQKAKPAPANNAPIVMRSDRIAGLFAWLRDNWVYAVSAVSLALAGIFLVQYGVEAGLLPPVVRVLMAIGLGAVLVVAGEWVRRRWGDGAKSSTAFLPSTLSGAGIVSMFAGVIAARQLYGLIGTEAAFAGLVLVAGLAIVLGWFYGPFLTAVGLIGAAIAPFAVGGSNSQYNGLYAFYPLIAFAGLAVDAVRRWAWVSVLALALGFGGVWLLAQTMGGAGWYAMALVVLALLAIAVPLKSLTPRHDGAMLTETVLGRRKDWPGFPTRLAAGSVALAVAGLGADAARGVRRHAVGLHLPDGPVAGADALGGKGARPGRPGGAARRRFHRAPGAGGGRSRPAVVGLHARGQRRSARPKPLRR